MRKECWIINKLTNQVFFGSLNTEIEVSNNYPYLEVPTQFIGKSIKWCNETNQIIEDIKTCFKKEVEYLFKDLEEFKQDILFKILYAEKIGNSSEAQKLISALTLKKESVEAVINQITENYYG